MSGMSARVGLGLRAVTSARVRGVGYNQNDVGYLGASGIIRMTWGISGRRV
jgi:hypothetical protein